MTYEKQMFAFHNSLNTNNILLVYVNIILYCSTNTYITFNSGVSDFNFK